MDVSMKKLFASILYTVLIVFFLQTNSFCELTNAKSKELYIKYTKYPKNVYTQQRFTVELEARILTNNDLYDFITTTYANGKNIDILDKDISWLEQGNKNIYTAKIIFKARNRNFILPTIRLAITQNGKDVDFVKIKPPKIKYNKIAINQEYFSNVIAESLKIKTANAKQYNNKMLMVVCNIETINGNLEEFYLQQFKDQGAQDFEDHYPVQIVYYYMIVPSHKKSIKFNYYNTKLSKFITVEAPISLEEELTSTQIGLNPHDSNLLFYKQMLSLLFFLIFIFLYFKTKNKIFILLFILMFAVFIKLILPNKKIFIAKNTKVFILPTKSSTVYKILDVKNEVEVLSKKRKFIKVLFKNKNIGWVKKSDIK